MTKPTSYYERAGFGVRVHRDDEGMAAGFASIDFDGQSVVDLDALPDTDPAANRTGWFLVASADT